MKPCSRLRAALLFGLPRRHRPRAAARSATRSAGRRRRPRAAARRAVRRLGPAGDVPRRGGRTWAPARRRSRRCRRRAGSATWQAPARKAANFELESSRTEVPAGRRARCRRARGARARDGRAQRGRRQRGAIGQAHRGAVLRDHRRGNDRTAPGAAGGRRCPCRQGAGRSHRHLGSRARAAHLDPRRCRVAACAGGGVQGLLRPSRRRACWSCRARWRRSWRS